MLPQSSQDLLLASDPLLPTLWTVTLRLSDALCCPDVDLIHRGTPTQPHWWKHTAFSRLVFLNQLGHYAPWGAEPLFCVRKPSTGVVQGGALLGRQNITMILTFLSPTPLQYWEYNPRLHACLAGALPWGYSPSLILLFPCGLFSVLSPTSSA